MAAASIGIIIIAVGILVLVGFAVGLTLWITGGGSKKSSEMSCGGCGYFVRGLEQLNCPECGADLRAVGIGTGTSGGRKLTGILLTVVCGVILLSCAGIVGLGTIAGSRSSTPMATPPTIHTTPLQPNSTQGTTDSGQSNITDSDEGEQVDPAETE